MRAVWRGVSWGNCEFRGEGTDGGEEGEGGANLRVVLKCWWEPPLDEGWEGHFGDLDRMEDAIGRRVYSNIILDVVGRVIVV